MIEDSDDLCAAQQLGSCPKEGGQADAQVRCSGQVHSSGETIFRVDKKYLQFLAITVATQ